MSKPLQIALVAEGVTDLVVIEAGLNAILAHRRDFKLTLLQPEETRPDMGGGWGGVFKWCKEFRERGFASLEHDSTLSLFDLVIVHLDADVADKNYADCGSAVENYARSALLPPLPCSLPCPPPDDTVMVLERVLLGWLGSIATGSKSVVCIPSKSTEAWVAAACLPVGHSAHYGLECNADMEGILARLPKSLRIKKTRREYSLKARTITENWPQIVQLCVQAARFQRDINLLLI
ncbi:hypothetical protein QCD60_08700 [Pokkaliibacter sp. MBI-7]|uniref:hypothetical protein n=1 Tax=Pokkaliibacter sp. MBI-7 TaxID=3040600 RepID=UPI00244D6AC0|nr:hypothetical protein [Pokkaliibacter sp. MBI-7]MDH2432645.1 hypothetical protein [Pokkaliibacter sp. MBI-7]